VPPTPLTELEDDSFTLVALDNGPGSVPIWEAPWPDRVALVAGNEVEGVSSALLERCTMSVHLPMFGYKRSLNVTTALGIAIYEWLRTFRSGQGLIPDESER
jgi:tRNA G18 (ribose-2'-O)-methylase SpoU